MQTSGQRERFLGQLSFDAKFSDSSAKPQTGVGFHACIIELNRHSVNPTAGCTDGYNTLSCVSKDFS